MNVASEIDGCIEFQAALFFLPKMRSDLIFRLYNHNFVGTNIVDLHGQSSQDVERILELVLFNYRDEFHSNFNSIKIIVGVGNRSRNNVAVVKPLVLKYCELKNFECYERIDNAGVIILTGF